MIIENNKNQLIKNIDMKNLTKAERNKIINEIKSLDFGNLNEQKMKVLKYTYENEINLIIKKKKENFKKNILGNWYNREKTIDDLIIFLLIIVLIGTIIIKFSSNINNLIIFLLNKIIFPNLLLITILIFIIIIYLYKKKFLYNIFDFILIWFKILTFQWLF